MDSPLRQIEQAIEYFEKALKIAHEIGDRQIEGEQLDNLGLAYTDQGQVGRAIEHYEKALEIFIEIQSPHAEQVRSKLAEPKA